MTPLVRLRFHYIHGESDGTETFLLKNDGIVCLQQALETVNIAVSAFGLSRSACTARARVNVVFEAGLRYILPFTLSDSLRLLGFRPCLALRWRYNV